MKFLRVQLNDTTYRALNRIAPAARGQRDELVGAAIRKAIQETEEERMRQAYRAQPDSEAEAADWSGAEEWKPGRKPISKPRGKR